MFGLIVLFFASAQLLLLLLWLLEDSKYIPTPQVEEGGIMASLDMRSLIYRMKFLSATVAGSHTCITKESLFACPV